MTRVTLIFEFAAQKKNSYTLKCKKNHYKDVKYSTPQQFVNENVSLTIWHNLDFVAVITKTMHYYAFLYTIWYSYTAVSFKLYCICCWTNKTEESKEIYWIYVRWISGSNR